MQVLAAVKGLVHNGISIVSTIHSPTPFCFGLFDSLTLLLRGRVVYAGPQGYIEPLPPPLLIVHFA